MQVWLEAWISVASSDNCARHDVPDFWADKCLKEFDKRFLDAKKQLRDDLFFIKDMRNNRDN